MFRSLMQPNQIESIYKASHMNAVSRTKNSFFLAASKLYFVEYCEELQDTFFSNGSPEVMQTKHKLILKERIW